MEEELSFSGLCISPRVFETVVTKAVEGIEGIACVGVPTQASTLFQLLTGALPQPQLQPVVSRAQGSKVEITVHVTAFFGYPFVELADTIRSTVAEQVETLTGIDVAAVNVCIDAIVFPKE